MKVVGPSTRSDGNTVLVLCRRTWCGNSWSKTLSKTVKVCIACVFKEKCNAWVFDVSEPFVSKQSCIKLHRMAELEGTSGRHQVQPTVLKQGHQHRLARSTSSRVLGISKDGASTASQGSPWWCMTSLPVKKGFFLCG